MCQEHVSGQCYLSVLQVLFDYGWHNTSVLFLFYICVLCVRSLCQANAACQFYKFYSSMDGKPPQFFFLFYTCVLCVRSLCQANAACQFYKFYSSMDGKPPQCFFFETCGRTVRHRTISLVTSRVVSKYHQSLRVWLHFSMKNKTKNKYYTDVSPQASSL
jgi:hypothetical protein